ncbi:MAG: GAF domain-containing sensor histidine kinase [Archangium sp.]|nr:GAF domain-containing sensor histidine kinase [Archangium sp.]
MAERTRTGRTDPGSGMPAKVAALQSATHALEARLAAVIDIGARLSSAPDHDTLLRTVMERLSDLVQAEAATLFVYDVATDELWSRVLRGSGLAEIRLPSSQGIAGHVFHSGTTLRIADAYADGRFNPSIDRRSGFRTRSIIAAPLRHVSGRVLGVVEVLHRKVDAFTADDRALVEGVAAQISGVLDNVRLVETLRQQGDALAQKVREVDALYEVEKAISGSAAEADLLDGILKTATDVLQARAGSILLADDDGDSLYFRSARGEQSDALKSVRLQAGQGIAGFVTATGEVVREGRADESPHHDRSIAKRLGVAVGAVLCVPIHAEGHTLGALELLNKRGGFSEADERLAVVLAGQIGRALVQRRSRDEEDRKARLAAIGQLLAGVLHDLRTPLTVISGYAELMIDEDERDARRVMSKAIISQLDHVAAMQRETLAFARGERSLFKRKAFMHAFMGEVEEQLRRELEPAGIELRVEVGYTGAARVDESKLKRAIFNLARNAADAMPKGGRFSLSLEREDDELVVRAADTGPGIPAEIADRLFQSFVTSGKRDGTGLGLAIVRKVAEEHGGSVSFKSRPGKGTTFELRIPADAPAD